MAHADVRGFVLRRQPPGLDAGRLMLLSRGGRSGDRRVPARSRPRTTGVCGERAAGMMKRYCTVMGSGPAAAKMSMPGDVAVPLCLTPKLPVALYWPVTE